MRASATGRASPPRHQEVLGPGRRGGDRTAQFPHRRYGGDGLQVVHDLRILNAVQFAGGEQEGLDVEVRVVIGGADVNARGQVDPAQSQGALGRDVAPGR